MFLIILNYYLESHMGTTCLVFVCVYSTLIFMFLIKWVLSCTGQLSNKWSSFHFLAVFCHHKNSQMCLIHNVVLSCIIATFVFVATVDNSLNQTSLMIYCIICMQYSKEKIKHAQNIRQDSGRHDRSTIN